MTEANTREPLDPLMRAIVATPDDDTPRLVWADREGGERGELVILQCRLAAAAVGAAGAAAKEMSREERRILLSRERELLSRYGAKWSPLAGLSKRTAFNEQIASGKYAFVRGFLEREALALPVLDDESNEVFSRAPLLRALELHEEIDAPERAETSGQPKRKEPVDWKTVSAPMLARVMNALPSGRITSISTRPSRRFSDDGWHSISYSTDWAKIISNAPPLQDSLTDLEITDGQLAFDSIRDLGSLRALERISLCPRFAGDRCIEMLRALPRVRSIALRYVYRGHTPALRGNELAIFLEAETEVSRLTELTLTVSNLSDEELTTIANAPSLARLTKLHLGVAGVTFRSGIIALAQSPYLKNLTDLSITAGFDDEALTILASAPFAPHLRKLHLPGSSLDAKKSTTTLLTAFPSLEHLTLLGSGLSTEHLDQLRAVLPRLDA